MLTALIPFVAFAALLAVWLALEPAFTRHYKRLKLYAMREGRLSRYARRLRLPESVQIALMPAIQGGSPELDLEDVELTEGEKAELKEVGDKADKLRADLVKRLGEMHGKKGEDKEEVERREEELAKHVDTLIGLEQKRESTEVQNFKAELEERLEGVVAEVKKIGSRPTGIAKAAGVSLVTKENRYPGENIFKDMKLAQKGDPEAFKRLAEYEEKFAGPEREKAWASGELEEVDLILPDIQPALPFLRAQARTVPLFREIRTNSPSVEFPVWAKGLTVGHVAEGEPKPESEPEWDLEVARVFQIAAVTDIPNPLLEDFPAARGWVATELGAATGAQEETDILSGDGTDEPLGLYMNTLIPKRKLDETAKATLGRNIITSVFRGAQQVRIEGHVEPTDVSLNPAVWTDVALTFEDNIGFLYGNLNSGTSGAPADVAPERMAGLPVTWSSYVPINEDDTSDVIVGNFQDGIVLRRSPFRIDVDSSPGFKKNLTTFRGEERMGFIVVRPKSFVKVTGITPSPIS